MKILNTTLKINLIFNFFAFTLLISTESAMFAETAIKAGGKCYNKINIKDCESESGYIGVVGCSI